MGAALTVLWTPHFGSVLFLQVGFGHNVDGPVLDFGVSFRQILPKNPHKKQLDAADEGDNGGGGGPAGHRVAEQKLSHHDKHRGAKSHHTQEEAHEGGQRQGHGGEGYDALDAVFEQLPEGPLGLTGYPFHIFKFNPLGLEAYPAKQALGKAVAFFTATWAEASLKEPSALCIS